MSIYDVVGLGYPAPMPEDDYLPFDSHLTGETLDPELASLIASIPANDTDPYEDTLVAFCVSCDPWKRDTVQLDIADLTVTLCLDCYDAAKAEADAYAARYPVWYGGSE